MSEISFEELRCQLASLNYNAGPINESTKSLYLKKLSDLRLQKQLKRLNKEVDVKNEVQNESKKKVKIINHHYHYNDSCPKCNKCECKVVREIHVNGCSFRRFLLVATFIFLFSIIILLFFENKNLSNECDRKLIS